MYSSFKCLISVQYFLTKNRTCVFSSVLSVMFCQVFLLKVQPFELILENLKGIICYPNTQMMQFIILQSQFLENKKI